MTVNHLVRGSSPRWGAISLVSLMAKFKDFNDQNSELFRKEMAGVHRLKYEKKASTSIFSVRNTAVHSEKTRPNEVSDTISDIFETENIESSDELLFFRPGVQRSLMRKLKRGQLGVGAELDLHGMTTQEARQALLVLLYECKQHHIRCIKIVHGKGKGSRNQQPILKNKINHWLPQLDEVLAFSSARPEDGGVGAVYVLLKRS